MSAATIEIATSQQVITELNLATTTAAVAVGPWVGMKDKLGADGAAVDSLVGSLSASELVSYDIATCEGVKDGAPHLPHGETLGSGPISLDLAADPVEKTTDTSLGLPGGMVLAALGLFPKWIGVKYMEQLIVSPEVADRMVVGGYISLAGDPAQNMKEVASGLRKNLDQLHIAVLDRPRNARIIQAAQELGARLSLLQSGDVMPALEICLSQEGDKVDMLYGSGGSPETIIKAAAVAGFGGNMQARWDPQSDAEREIVEQHANGGQVYHLRDLIGPKDDVYFSAAAITENPFVPHVTYDEESGVWLPGGSISIHGVATSV